ncbi:MAG: G8 domain-containing protein [Trueperaceae bacterium]
MLGERWSDPATWGGVMPGEGAVVEIPKGKTVVLDISTPRLGGLYIQGELLFDHQDVSLSSNWIAVAGRLAAGQETAVHPSKAEIILTGTDPNADTPFAAGAGAKYLLILEGGKLELHGQTTTSWTNLSTTAPAGTNQITLAAAVNWQVGQRIAISSTDFANDQHEERTISAIEGTNLTLDQPLQYLHYGELQSYSHQDKTWTLDERAEVALLNRNIIIRSEDGRETGFGGHVMAMKGSQLNLSNVELEHMGQRGILGRYPIHFHQMADATGSYLRALSLHHTFSRCVTVHASDNLVLEDNVCYETPGHAFFLEDGAEQGNIFKNNLGMATRMPAENDALLPTDLTHVSTFWITNAANTFEGNVAAGSDKAGFWFTAGSTPTGLSKDLPIYPKHIPIRVFTNNKAHSNHDNLSFEGDFDSELNLVPTPYQPRAGGVLKGEAVVPVVDGFTGYKARDRNIWTRANSMRFKNVVAADSGKTTLFAANQTLEDSLVVGLSANKGTPVRESEIAAGRSLPNNDTHRGHSIYDGPSGLINVHFAGFTGPKAYAIQTNGAAVKAPVHFAQGISFAADVPQANKVDFSANASTSTMWSSGLIDKDGSLTGVVGATVIPKVLTAKTAEIANNPAYNKAADCTDKPEWSAWICPSQHHFGLLLSDHNIPGKKYDNALLTLELARSDGAKVYEAGTSGAHYQSSVIVNEDYSYSLNYVRVYDVFDVSLRFINPGDSVRVDLPVAALANYHVKGKATKVSSLADLAASTTTAYFFANSRMHLKLVGEVMPPNPRTGAEYSSEAKVTFCRYEDCKVTDYP